MEPAWDHATLRAWFDARAGTEVLETELLRAFFPEEDPFENGAGLELFQKHFLLYRRLWLLDDELRLTTGERLWIRGIRCTLLPAPAANSCGWLDEETGLYCRKNHLCPHRTSEVPQGNSMKSYYLDWSNLEGMTDEKVRALVEGFFRWMGGANAAADALEAWGLPADADAATIKSRWRALSLEHHPDRGGDEAQYKKISAAWAALKSRF